MPPTNSASPFAAIPGLPPAQVLAWSEAFVDAAVLPRPRLALWVPTGECVAIGLAQRPEVELTREALAPGVTTLLRRQSGGGAVLLYPGVLCWEAMATLPQLAASGEDGAGIRGAYRILTQPILAGLARLGVVAELAGVSDVAVRDATGEWRKLAGTAQLRRREAVLVHGSLLVTADVSRLAELLALPRDKPEYRRERGHRAFCCTVREVLALTEAEAVSLPQRLGEAIAQAALAAEWEVRPPPEELPLAAYALWRDKYASPAWNWSRQRV